MQVCVRSQESGLAQLQLRCRELEEALALREERVGELEAQLQMTREALRGAEEHAEALLADAARSGEEMQRMRHANSICNARIEELIAEALEKDTELGMKTEELRQKDDALRVLEAELAGTKEDLHERIRAVGRLQQEALAEDADVC